MRKQRPGVLKMTWPTSQKFPSGTELHLRSSWLLLPHRISWSMLCISFQPSPDLDDLQSPSTWLKQNTQKWWQQLVCNGIRRACIVDLLVEKYFLGKVSIFYDGNILAFITGIRVRGWDFCPAVEKERQKVHHRIAGSDSLISATWLCKYDWGSAGFCLLYFLGEGYFILTQKPNLSRKGQNKECKREGNVLFIPLRAPSQTKAPTYSPTFFSVDYFLRRPVFLYCSSNFLPYSALLFSQSGSFPVFPLLTFSPLCLGPNVRAELPDAFWDAHRWYRTQGPSSWQHRQESLIQPRFRSPRKGVSSTENWHHP